jgi:hypothetical protein
LQHWILQLAYHGSFRYPTEDVGDAILQVWKNAAPMITVSHDETAAYHGVSSVDLALATI